MNRHDHPVSRLIPWVGLVMVMLIFTVACNTPGIKEKRTVFRYNEAPGISSLDPAFARGQADIWACNQLYNGLVQMDDDLMVQPCIASSWAISEDGTTYRFKIRSDVRFHDSEVFPAGKGRNVTAHDFVYSFSRLVDPKIASPGSWVFNTVAMDSTGTRLAISAPSADSLIIRLAHSFPPFLGILTSQYCSVVPREAIEKYGKDFRIQPVGTGPFMFHEWHERTNLIYWKNPNYFETDNGNRLPYLDAVSISFISDRQSAFLEFLKGNLDFISGLDASYKDDLLTRKGTLREHYANKIEMQTCPYLNTEYLGILMDPGKPASENPLSDVRIRKAINMGFDRVKMIAFLRNGIGTPGTEGMVPPGLPSFDSAVVRGFSYDPAGAIKLLAEAGFPGGKGLPEILMSTTKEYQDLCEFMQGQLAEIGIRIKLEVNPGATQRELVAKQQLAFFRASWIADYPDAENYLSLFYSPNKAPAGPNYTHFSNPEFDRLYEEAGSTTNDSIRFLRYQEMDQLIMDAAPVVILYYDQVIRLHGKNIEGLGSNGMNLLKLKKVKKLPE
jgi:oligopeptide transport system substrate-binding protein